MKNNTSFVRRFFLCALFCLSTTASMASTRTVLSSDSDGDEDHSAAASATGGSRKEHLDVSREFYTIDSLSELAAIFEDRGIEWGPETAFILDNDETISWSIFLSHIMPADLPNPFLYLCCPDLGRTYKKTLAAAAALLHERDDSKTVKNYIDEIMAANLWMVSGPDSGYRHTYQPLEQDALSDVLTSARDAKTYVKICSGLGLTQQKSIFFHDHKDELCFTLPHRFSSASEGLDYLCAHPFGKAGRTVMDLSKSFGDLDNPLETIILVDNSPGACNGFLKQMTEHQLRKIKGVSGAVRVISVQYNAFAKRITPELVADDYERYVIFFEALQRQKEADRERLLSGAAGSGSGTDYDIDFTILSDSSSEDSEDTSSGSDSSDSKDTGHSTDENDKSLLRSSHGTPFEDEQDDPAPLKDDDGGDD